MTPKNRPSTDQISISDPLVKLPIFNSNQTPSFSASTLGSAKLTVRPVMPLWLTCAFTATVNKIDTNSNLTKAYFIKNLSRFQRYGAQHCCSLGAFLRWYDAYADRGVGDCF